MIATTPVTLTRPTLSACTRSYTDAACKQVRRTELFRESPSMASVQLSWWATLMAMSLWSSRSAHGQKAFPDCMMARLNNPEGDWKQEGSKINLVCILQLAFMLLGFDNPIDNTKSKNLNSILRYALSPFTAYSVSFPGLDHWPWLNGTKKQLPIGPYDAYWNYLCTLSYHHTNYVFLNTIIPESEGIMSEHASLLYLPYKQKFG